MGNVTVIGAQWGDEGKGKIVDWLSNQADIVFDFKVEIMLVTQLLSKEKDRIKFNSIGSYRKGTYQ